MAMLDEMIAILGIDYEDKGDTRRFAADLKNAERSFQRFSDGVTTLARRAVIGVGAITAGLGAALGKGVIDASAQWEGFEVALTTIEGSSEKAKKSLDWIEEFARKTPYQLAETVQAFTKLRAYGIDATDGTLRTLGDTASAMNKPLDAAIEMFADAASFQFERLREFGIVASQEGEKVTFQWVKDGKTIRETVDKTGEAVTKFLKQNLEGRFGGAMIRQSATWSGMLSNMWDYWDSFQRRIGAGGFFDVVKNRLAGFLEYLDTLDGDGTLDRWSANLSWGFTKAADGVAYLAGQIVDNIATMTRLFGDAKWEGKVKPFLAVMGLILARLFPVTALLTAAALALNDWLKYMEGADSVIGNFIKTLADFLGADPQAVASVLGEMAQMAGWLAAGAIGVGLFAGAIRSLGAALAVVALAKGAVGILSALTALRFGAAAAGAAGAAAAAGGATAGGAARSAAAATGTAAAAVGTFLRGLIGRIGILAATPGSPWSGVQLQPFTDEQRELLRKRHEERSANPRNDRQGWSGGGFDENRSGDGFMSGIRDKINGLVDGATARIDEAFQVTGGGTSGANTAALQRFIEGMQNAQSRMATSVSMSAVDSRSFPVTNNVSAPVTVNVQQASQAPAAAGAAVGRAVGQAAVQSRAQVAQSAAAP